MANSRKSLTGSARPLATLGVEPGVVPHPIEQELVSCIERQQRVSQNLAVALSGGMDSMVLLEAMVRLRPVLDLRLQAIHVHHGISAHADAWAAHCESMCAARDVPLVVRRIKVTRAGGESLEARARELRYDYFAELDADAIALAHHLDDQCETFFLRLLRGAGVEGLGGMSECRALQPGSAIQVLRPFLNVGREQLLEYARLRALPWIEDDSNTDTRFTRNHLRTEVLPRIAERFPSYRTNIARAMLNLREAGASRHTEIESVLPEAMAKTVLALAPLRAMTQARALVVLRAFLRGHGERPPARAHLLEIWRQARDATDDANVRIKVEGGSLRRYRDTLHFETSAVPAVFEASFTWNGQPDMALPDGMGTLRFVRVMGAGIDERQLLASGWTITQASPAMRMRLARDRPTRTLKNLFQEAGVPPWQRPRTPALRRADQTVWVGGMGYDVSVQPMPGSPGVRIEWISARPDATPVPPPDP